MKMMMRLCGVGGFMIVGLTATVVPPSRARAEPVRQRVLDEIDVRGDDACSIIRVSFNFPVRYMSHFPLEKGAELRIQLQPIAVSTEDLDALFKRESLVPTKFDDRVPLREVVYEGDSPGARYLTLRFDRSVSFGAGQGPDFRSLQAGLPGPANIGACPPERE